MKKTQLFIMLFVAIVVGTISAMVVTQPAKAVLNANTDDLQITFVANSSGYLQNINASNVGLSAGGIALSGSYNVSYSWNVEGVNPSVFTNLTDAQTRGVSDSTNSLRFIPIDTTTVWGPNQRVTLTIHKNDSTSRLYGFHGWQPNMATQNTNTLLSAMATNDNRASTMVWAAEIKSFGTFSNLTSLRQAFYATPSTFVVSAQLPSTVTSVANLFTYSQYDSSAIADWDTSQVQDFSFMFNSSSFNQPIGNWNMSSATSLSGMFQSVSLKGLFNQDISSWDVSKVTNFSYMFRSSHSQGNSFNQPIGSWDLSSATNLLSMFEGASSFNQSLNSWNVSNVSNFGSLFKRYSSSSQSMTFNQPLSSWNTAKGSSFSSMFQDNTAFNQDLSSWNTARGSNFSNMFSGATNFNNGETYVSSSPGTKPLSWDMSSATTIGSMFSGATKFNQSVSGWNLASADVAVNSSTSLTNVFNGATGFNNGFARGISGVMDWTLPKYGANKNLIGIFQNASSFNQDISSWDLWYQKDSQGIISGATSFDQPIGHFGITTLMTGSGNSSIKFDGMSQTNYNTTIAEWAYRKQVANSYVTYFDLANRLKQYSTCLSAAAYTQLTQTVPVANRATVGSFIAGTNPGSCVDRTVTWQNTATVYRVPRLVAGQSGVYEISPDNPAISANSGVVKYLMYDRTLTTGDCKVDPTTGIVTYKVLGASCTISAYAASQDSQALSSVTTTFTTSAPASWVVTYSYNSATSGNSTATTTWTSGDNAIALPVPSRTGYDFVGWYKEAGFTNATGLTFTPTANITLYARFTSTVTYDSQGGSAVPAVTLNAGSGTTLNSSLTRAGYTFAGWYSSTDFVTRVPASNYSYSPTGNITLYAKWTANTLTVSYSVNGGSSVSNTSTTTGSTVSEPSATTRTGYTFSGWYSDSGLTTPISTWPYTHNATSNFALYAGWTANTLAVTYSTNGGSSLSNGSTVTGGTISTEPVAPTRAGYTLVGWYSDSGLSTAISWPYVHGKTADFTIYAKWTANTLTVTYVSSGGTNVANGSTSTGATISSAPTAPTRTGYNFIGWFTDSGLTTAVTWPYTHGQVADFTLYSKWTSRTQQNLSWNLSSTSVPYLGTLSLGVSGGSGTGSVTYSVSNTSTCTVSGTTLTPGQGGSVCVVTATKAADSNYDAISTVQQTITVSKINQSSFSWNLSSTSVAYLGTLTLATTGGSGTGAVVYSASGGSTCSIVGTTLIPSDAGSTCEITATKVSDSNYNSADTATQTITVTKISQATLSFSNSNSLVYGQTMDLLATGGSGGGSITYAVSNAGTTGCSLSANLLSVTGAGTCAVTAVRASSTNYNASSTASLSITVSKASQTVSFSSTVPDEPIAGDTYTVTATTSSGLTPTITIASGPCTISNGVVTLTSAGNCVISADSSSTNQYLAATAATQTVAIGQRNQTLTFSATVRAITVKTFGDPVFFADASTSEATLTPVYSRGSATTNTSCSVTSTGLVVILAVGNCEIEVNQPGDSAVAAASAIKKSFEVIPDRANAPFITSVSAGHESITAAFTAPNYVGGSSITGYQLAAVAGSTTITNSACTLAGSGNTETCTINGLTNGTSYRIKVAAITAAGVGLYSELSAARVPATNPAAVSAFTAVPDNTSIVLTWQDPVSLGGGTFDSYRVFYKLSSSASYPGTYITIQNQSPTSYTITGLINGESYDVKIVTVTTANTASLVSNTAEVKETPRTVPEAPATIEVIEVAGQLVITWSNPQSDGGNAITEYRVTINGTTCTLANALDNLCTIPVPTNGGSYPIEVRAKNDAGYGEAATASFTKAGVSSSGGSGGGSESSQSGQTAIQVISLSVKSLPSVGGQVVSITGKNLGGVTTVLIDGIKAKIISVTDGLIKFTAPRNTDGPATLSLKSPTASAEVVDAFVYSAGIAKVKVAWVLGFVQTNTTIKAADKAKLRSALLKNTGTVAITCIGYQSYSYNTAKDKATAIGRAKQACNYLKSINPSLSVKTVVARTNLVGPASRKLAVQYRTSK